MNELNCENKGRISSTTIAYWEAVLNITTSQLRYLTKGVDNSIIVEPLKVGLDILNVGEGCGKRILPELL